MTYRACNMFFKYYPSKAFHPICVCLHALIISTLRNALKVLLCSLESCVSCSSHFNAGSGNLQHSPTGSSGQAAIERPQGITVLPHFSSQAIRDMEWWRSDIYRASRIQPELSLVSSTACPLQLKASFTHAQPPIWSIKKQIQYKLNIIILMRGCGVILHYLYLVMLSTLASESIVNFKEFIQT